MKKPVTGKSPPLDRQARKILQLLQQDATTGVAEIAEAAGMSVSSCWRRIRELRETGVITGQTVLVDAALAGLPICVIATVSLKDKSRVGQTVFEQFALDRPEIQECLLLSGERDYQLKVLVASIEAYERFLTAVLLDHPNVQSATSSFVLRRTKATTVLPL